MAVLESPPIIMPGFRRKPTRLPKPSYDGQRCYFLTICTHERKKVFQDSNLVHALIDVLEETCVAHSFQVYAYCFMPDHLHLILVAGDVAASLPSAVRAFKGIAASKLRARGGGHLWHKGFYDRVIRTGEGLDAVAWYIFMNPVRAGLVKRIGQWPFSGSFMFDWTRVTAPPEPFVPPWKKPVAG